MRVELLAPAKNKETAMVAINSGADAIYIGATFFGARHNAANSIDDIREIVNYAHKFYVKVYVTINTILSDEELFKAQNLIFELEKIGIDAIIIQDMGLLELSLPDIPIHASTQCNNRNLEKIKFLEQTGFSRIILARELSLKQIEEICQNTNVEIETFIHGSLCVSYSGQCYLSEYIGGRSANRGICAQPCRKKYSLIDENGNVLIKNKHLLSLKDFNASDEIFELIKAGVTSFKIEGRLKDKNYVKNVVLHYRNLIDKYASKTSSGSVFSDFVFDINKTFNRNYTNYFLKQRHKIYNFETPKFIGEKIGKIKQINKNYFVLDGHNLSNQDGLCYFENNELKGILVNKVDGDKIYPNKMPKLKKDTTLYRNIDVNFIKKLENAVVKRKIKVDFIMNDEFLIAKDEDNNEVRIKLNNFEIANSIQKAKQKIIEQLRKTGDSIFYTENIIINIKDIPYIPVSKINELRRNILDLLLLERLKNYPKKSKKTVKTIPYFEKELDYKANIHNMKAKEFYAKRGVKTLEYSYENKHQKNIELMRTKHCLKYAINKCKSKEKLFLIDEYDEKYILEFDCDHCEMIIKK